MNFDYTERMARLRLTYPNAYRPWTGEDDGLLCSGFEAGASLQDLVKLLACQPGAIRSRLRKLALLGNRPEFSRPPVDGPAAENVLARNGVSLDEAGVDLHVTLEWLPVMEQMGRPYHFPNVLTSYMKQQYRGPAVYRWTVYRTDPALPSALYIGTSKCLCPDRLLGYLDPGASKTNARINQQFDAFLQQGLQIGLQILTIHKATLDGCAVAPGIFNSSSSRLLLEALMIEHYRRQGVQLLNM